MPKVGNKEFAYTAQGLAEAKAEAAKTGEQIQTTDAGSRRESYHLGGQIPGQQGFGERPQPVAPSGFANQGMNPLGDTTEVYPPTVPPIMFKKGGKVDRKAKREADREAKARKRHAEGKYVYSKKYRDLFASEKKAVKVKPKVDKKVDKKVAKVDKVDKKVAKKVTKPTVAKVDRTGEQEEIKTHYASKRDTWLAEEAAKAKTSKAAQVKRQKEHEAQSKAATDYWKNKK